MQADEKKADPPEEAGKEKQTPPEESNSKGAAEADGSRPVGALPFPMPAPATAAALEEKRIRKKRKASEVAIRLRKVTKRFGPKTAVDQVTLKVDTGLVYGLIGPNGAGKTTTFSMLAGYLKPTEGSLEVLGFAPTVVEELRSRVGVLPQDAILPASDKVGEFLVHMARLQGTPAEQAVNEAEDVLAEVDGKEWWAMKCGALSHGMAKRVALAQAFLGDPDVLLLDEPTAGLDPRVAWEIRQLIRGRKGRCTIIISSHNLQELEEICDAAAILDRGRVVASGAMGELTAQSQEVHIKVAPPAQPPTGGSRASYLPLAQIRELPIVKLVEFDEEASEIVVYFEPRSVDAETVIGNVLWILLQQQVRISGVSKGRSLEQRVMALT